MNPDNYQHEKTIIGKWQVLTTISYITSLILIWDLIKSNGLVERIRKKLSKMKKGEQNE